MEILKFPKGFKWGSATSAHQIEGNNHNDWSKWEKSEKRIAELKKAGKNPDDFVSGKACDSFNRYEEDFDIAKKLNQNIHRFSIEWSRIEPEEGRFDSEAMQHYINVVKSLRERGIEPMITLWHFTNPVWFSNKGGFLNKRSPEYFTRYAKYVVDNLKNQVSLWITFNEATTVYSGLSYLIGLWPPQFKSLFAFYNCNKNIIQSHIKAYKEIKKLYNHSPVLNPNLNSSDSVPRSSEDGVVSHNVGKGEIGIVENNVFIPDTKNFLSTLMRRIFRRFRNFYFFNNTPYYDFVGLNYYYMSKKPAVPEKEEIVPRGDINETMGWELYPEGIYHVLKDLKKIQKPVYITENGITDATDSKREKFIKDHLYWVWKAIQDGVDVRGYLYWSLLDNFEWAHGFGPRFGLVEVDYNNNCARKIRPSAEKYAKICLTNQLEVD